MVENWPPTSNIAAPPIPSEWGEQLLKIGGKAPNGKPILRLVWGQSPEASVFYCGKMRLKYLHHWERRLVGYDARYYDHAGQLEQIKRFPPSLSAPEAPGAQLVEPVYDTMDIGIPRWFVEQYIPPETACIDWEKHRYKVEEDGTLTDELGPRPSEGTYEEAFLMIADHEDCCGDGFMPGCPGTYRQPSSKDIEYVRWLFFQLNKEPFRYNWTDVPPPEVVAQALLERKNAQEEKEEKQREETEYWLRNELMTHRNRVFQNGHGLDRFTYHDLGAAFARAKKF